MNAPARTTIAVALVAIAMVALFLGIGPLAGQMPGTETAAGGGNVDAGLSEYSGYLILTLINVGLGSVVVWMLFGKRD